MRFEEFFEPETVEECIALKRKLGRSAVFVSGGTDVVPKLKSGALKPEAVISLHRIQGLDSIEVKEDGLYLGAFATLRKISLSDALAGEYEVVGRAAGHVSSMQVRNIATIGGNVCNASPSADAVQGLLVLDAVCRIQGPDGKYEKPLADFFLGPGKTILGEDELLTGFFVPKPAARTGAAYVKYSIRGDTDISIVGAGAALSPGADEIVVKARVTLASVAPTPLRVAAAEDFLEGKKPAEAVFEEAAEIAKNACAPIDDQRATADYRKEMVRVQTRIVLKEAYNRIRQAE